MSNRKSVGARVRFEVFKRDSFTCQYCGVKAPEVILEVDHIKPVADGGSNDLLNLVTSCRECNSGKSDKRLSDESAVQKSRAQADELQARRQQVEMISKWHLGLSEIDSDAAGALELLCLRAFGLDDGTVLFDHAKQELARLAKRYGHDTVCKGITAAAGKLLMSGESSDYVAQLEAFNSIGRICGVIKAAEKDPGIERLFYIRGILRRRLSYVNDKHCIVLLKDARDGGIEIDWLEELSKQVTSWTQFRLSVEAAMIGDECQEQDDMMNLEEATDGTST